LIIHVVKPNETIYTIARSYGVPPSQIINDNELSDPNKLVVGQTLVILYSSTVKQGTMSVSGYAYPYISEDVLRKTLPYLTYITIFSYAFDENGNLFDIDDEEIISISKEYGVAPILVVTTLTPEGLFGSELSHKLMNDPAMQDRLIANLLDVVSEKGYYGVNIDFEYIYAEDRDLFSEFIRKIALVMNEHGYILTVALAPKTSSDQVGLLYEGHDYKALGEAADWVLLMTYEWGYAYGPPMAVAPINKVKEVVDYAVSEIDPQKIMMGIPNYGYDWQLPFVRGTRATTMGNVEAVDQAADVLTAIMYDEVAQSPYYNYHKDGNGHIVWFEDARSIETKLQTANEYGLMGVEYWHLMKFFPQNWLVLNAQYNIEKVQL